MSVEKHQKSEEIPDHLIASLQSLEQETSLVTDEQANVDDIMKDLLELDPDFLDALAPEICADFVVAKCTDYEMDTLWIPQCGTIKSLIYSIIRTSTEWNRKKRNISVGRFSEFFVN